MDNSIKEALVENGCEIFRCLSYCCDGNCTTDCERYSDNIPIHECKKKLNNEAMIYIGEVIDELEEM